MTSTIPRAGGILLGGGSAVAAFWRIAQTIGTSFPLEIAAILLLGVANLGILVGSFVYWSIAGEPPQAIARGSP